MESDAKHVFKQNRHFKQSTMVSEKKMKPLNVYPIIIYLQIVIMAKTKTTMLEHRNIV